MKITKCMKYRLYYDGENNGLPYLNKDKNSKEPDFLHAVWALEAPKLAAKPERPGYCNSHIYKLVKEGTKNEIQKSNLRQMQWNRNSLF